jgi:ribosomal protein S4
VSLFHIKQKLRQFHGKLTENKFRIRFKTHKTNVASNSNSFFVNLESRLDLIFFRIRLLPTVFACHQFIIYNGLEINSKLEKSPSYQLKIGEIVSVPKTS